jgi:hypothetical protein
MPTQLDLAVILEGAAAQLRREHDEKETLKRQVKSQDYEIQRLRQVVAAQERH